MGSAHLVPTGHHPWQPMIQFCFSGRANTIRLSGESCNTQSNWVLCVYKSNEMHSWLTRRIDFDALWVVNGSSEIPFHSTTWPLTHLVLIACIRATLFQYYWDYIFQLLDSTRGLQHTKIVPIPCKSLFFIIHWLVSSLESLSNSEITFSTKFYKSNCNEIQLKLHFPLGFQKNTNEIVM